MLEARIAHAAGFILAGVILGSIAVRHFRRVRDPLLDLTTLGVPTYAVTVLWGSATRIGIALTQSLRSGRAVDVE